MCPLTTVLIGGLEGQHIERCNTQHRHAGLMLNILEKENDCKV
jgi:hypothetical protein